MPWERENERLKLPRRPGGTLYKRVVIASRYQYGGAAEEKAEKILGGLDPELVQSLAEAAKRKPNGEKRRKRRRKRTLRLPRSKGQFL